MEHVVTVGFAADVDHRYFDIDAAVKYLPPCSKRDQTFLHRSSYCLDPIGRVEFR